LEGKSGIDVVFLGATIPEEWNGRKFGKNATEFDDVRMSFQRRFRKDQGGHYQGLPLGISGDTSPNVLWRLRHGEMKDLNPKFWWIILGKNDFTSEQCSAEVVLLGILRVIEEIRTHHPDVNIIVNSILPLSGNRDGRIASRDVRVLGPGAELINNGIKRRRTKFLFWSENKHKQASDINIKVKKHMGLYWPAAAAVNQQLRIFCEKNKRNTYYFDSNLLFLHKTNRGKFIKKELMSDMLAGDLTEKGHLAWHRAIVKKMKTIEKANKL